MSLCLSLKFSPCIPLLFRFYLNSISEQTSMREQTSYLLQNLNRNYTHQKVKNKCEQNLQITCLYFYWLSYFEGRLTLSGQ